MNEAWWRAPCLQDAVYIIRGSYLTYLWQCIRPGISEYVCVYVSLCAPTHPPFFIKCVCCPLLTPLWSLPSGVLAWGRASAAAGLTPQGSSQTYRHSAAAIQSPAGEEAVCQDERSSNLHPGTVQSFFIITAIISIYFISSFPFCVTLITSTVYVLGDVPESCFWSWALIQRIAYGLGVELYSDNMIMSSL